MAWGDLLGYGGRIAEAQFNPLDARAKSSIKRMRDFHRIVAEHSNRNFRTLVINDGVAVFRDLSLRSSSVSHDFLMRSWELFEAINQHEARASQPGIRMVVACGFRIRGRKAVIETDHGKVNSILKRYQDGFLTVDQAIREASTARPSFDAVPQLQANFAFTKAYVAESSGTGGGFAGPNFFLDTSLLKKTDTEWPVGGKAFDWEHNTLGLKSEFMRIEHLSPEKYTNEASSRLKTGLEVAQTLAGDNDVLEALRRARKN
ncbi:hypothetical protein [Ruegeria jejuensis]|uniref:hypothetical protein n=1 Tax=Ruegeria jejuensis TaxID=3233338 RepID=UPI00355BED05